MHASAIGKKRHVTVDMEHEMDIGPGGALQPSVKRSKPPEHKALQKASKRLGKKQMSGFLKLSAAKRKLALAQMKPLMKQIEGQAIHSGFVGSDHARKAKAFADDPSGKGFRKIFPGQDEFTQSKRTASQFMGMNKRMPASTDAAYGDARRFRNHSARLLSSLRVPTEDVSTPMDVGGSRVGTRHPTNPSVPTWSGGSAHSREDRQRAESVNAFGQQHLASGPVHSVLATGAQAVSYSLANMSASHTASNVFSPFPPTRAMAQAKRREVIKDMGNRLFQGLGESMPTTTQPFKAPIVPLTRPTSPRRK